MSSRVPTFRFGYDPALDGVRGLAVLVVMAFHAHVPYFGFGFLGVDAFFVLSGFLITCLLLTEWQRYTAIDLRAFYLRRMLRLVPALVVMVGACTLFDSFILHDDASLRNVTWTLLYVSNWARAFELAPNSLLAHTWSLAVEEQFYLLWPPLLLVLVKRGHSLGRISAVVSGLIAASALLKVGLYEGVGSVDRLYLGFDTRADALLVGCLLALLVAHGGLPRGRTAHLTSLLALGVGALGLLALTMATGAEPTSALAAGVLYRAGGMTAVALGGAVLIAQLTVFRNRALRLLCAARPLVGVGRLSYGLYLWHCPLFAVLDGLGLAGPAGLVVRFGLAFLAATLSYYLVERPALQLKHRLSARAAELAQDRSNSGRPPSSARRPMPLLGTSNRETTAVIAGAQAAAILS